MGEKKRKLDAAAALTQQVAAARALHAAGKLHAAQETYRRVLQADLSRADAWLGLGVLARDTGHRDAALQFFSKAAEYAPQDGQARMAYAAALQDRDDLDAACTQWRAACALLPEDASAWESLGIAQQAAGDVDGALQAYARAHSLAPGSARHVKLATAIAAIPPSRAAIAAQRARMRQVLDDMLAGAVSTQPDPLQARLWTNFYLAYHGENDRELQSKTAALYRRICPSLDYVAAHCEQPAPPDGKIRIGLVSQFFRDHSIGRTSRGFFAQLSRERFEVTAIFLGTPVEDAVSQAIRRDADHTLVVPHDLDAAREQIAALRLDILFYQDIGMEPFGYFLSFARLAPVQCVSFGHPDTSGVPTVDYFISNDLYEPDTGDAGGAAAHYSEHLVTLHDLGSLAYYERPLLRGPRKTRAAFGLPAAPLYLCPQNLFKVHPDMDDLLAGILRRDPHGVIALVDGRVRGWSQRLRERWTARMGDLQRRIVFVPRLNSDDYLQLIACADVMLDTVHFNGMNTSLEAFAVGTPVVTLPARFQRGRHTQAMYRRMEMDEMIAADAAQYVELACRLANDPDFRATASARILERNGVLFEDRRVIDEFERFFAAAVKRVTRRSSTRAEPLSSALRAAPAAE